VAAERNGDFCRECLTEAKRILVKVGTRVVTDPTGGLDLEFLDRLAGQIATLQAAGCEVILVTSGSVHLGRRKLSKQAGKETLTYRQAAAAIGQPELMRSYSKVFEKHGLVAAQLLLTMDDMVNRQRYLNVRNALELLLQRGVVPVINENDSVSLEGVTFVENDKLASLVATKLRVDLLIFLSDEDGLYTEHPGKSRDAQLIPLVRSKEVLSASIGAAGGPESRGGMQAKVLAARTAADLGIPVVMANGKTEDIVVRVCGAEELGTLFLPGRKSVEPRKAWWATAAEPVGKVIVDAGACRALRKADGASLLPAGVRGTEGEYEAGDLVSVVGPEGAEVARGLVNYGSAEVAAIAGKHTSQLAEILGHVGHDEVIHRDNLVLVTD
jgi:glutamate 5-kinase